jgi:hypothetical protein
LGELPEWLKEAGVVRNDGEGKLSDHPPNLKPGTRYVYLEGGPEKADWRLVVERRGGDLYIVTDMTIEEARREGLSGG